VAVGAGSALVVSSRGGDEHREVATVAQRDAAVTSPPIAPVAVAQTTETEAAQPAPAKTPPPAPTQPKRAAPGGKVTAKDPPPAAAPVDAGLDPSVHIGSNVHIGPGVTIGGQPVPPTTTPPPPSASKSTITKPADYSAKRFDPVAYLPKALALAQQLIPDARLTSFEFDPVFPDGHVDLTMDGRDREYNFRSPSASARPAGTPRNLPVERACMVHVEVGATEITATVRKNDDCNARLVRAPSCRFGGVWKQAIANGTPTDVVARIGWLFDEKWFFDVDLEGKGGGVSSFPDRCP
jgi:hypothetical protein